MLRDLYSHTKKILLDANLLVLLLAAKAGANLIRLSPGNQTFDANDADLLDNVVAEYKYENMIITPYLLSEVNSLLTKLDINSRTDARRILATLIPTIDYYHTKPDLLACDPDFAEFGITDISILHASETATLVLTEDGRLAGLLKKRRDVLTYKDLKDMI